MLSQISVMKRKEKKIPRSDIFLEFTTSIWSLLPRNYVCILIIMERAILVASTLITVS
jgi:hypothetical protein